MSNSAWNMYVFRDGKRTVSGPELVSALHDALCRWQGAPERAVEDHALAALIAAGELECALLDAAGDEDSCNIAAEITESLACAFLTGQRDSHSSIFQCIQQLHVAAHYQVAVQEGFAYYALHPRKIAMLLDTLGLQSPMAVLGIRSIGVTLSAVACAALRLRGTECRRRTVRPSGHPYDRSLELTPEFRAWIARAPDAEFLVLDEGPGISGSSFLAVAEALVQCGVEDQQIQMIGSRTVDDPSTLRATNARERWTRYQYHVMKNAPLAPAEAGESLSGGTWRRYFHCEEDTMPASWAPLETAKILSLDERSIFKFEGYGHYGAAIGQRAKLLAECGFAPRYLGNHSGFGQYELVPGKVLQSCEHSPELLERIAGYLALRSTEFASNTPQTPEIEKMLRWNWQLEFGEELDLSESQFCIARVVVCDGRMMPNEWLRTRSGELLKLDAGNHGDNHFFPGPCDIAWDVAGAIVEWEMEGEVRERFVVEYEARSGDAVAGRLAPYLLAYTTFRMGWCKMAALAMQGEYDEALLHRDYEQYRDFAWRLRQKPSSPGLASNEDSATAVASLRAVSAVSNYFE
jgi:hypothetical protein